MTKRKNTKRALLLSALSLLMCVSLLIGSTFAWFTDSVTSANNIIQSGNLDIELEYWDGDSWEDVAGKSDILTNELWEPGVTEVAYLHVKNAGSLALKYQLGVNIVSETEGVNAAGETFKLSDYIQFGVVEGVNGETNKYATREDAIADLEETKKISAGYNKTSFMESGDELYLALVVYMPTTTDNRANHNGTDVPEIELGINVLATQYTFEEDSFDKDYDAGAVLSGIASGDAPAMGETKEFVVKNNINGATIAVVSIPGAAVEDPVAPITINVIPTADDANVTVESTQNINTYEVVVTNLKENNTESVEVELFVGINMAGVKLYHKDVQIPYDSYDPATGWLTFTTTSFSPFSVVYDKPVAKIGDTGYNTLAEAFADAKNGDMIDLRSGYNTTDAPLTETIVVNKEVTLNPNGMYLVSSAPATFEVAEGGSLTVAEGSFTIKNTATNGAAVQVNGGAFTMAGGSFDAHTAVRTAEGKSSTVTLAAGWSNRVTVGFDLKGNDTLNVTGGSLYTSKESVKTVADTHVNFNMSGGLLSGRTDQYSATVKLLGTATINMTGGKIENTYSSGYNGSSAIEANVAPTTINMSGSAALSSNGTTVMLGSHWSEPAVLSERFVLNMSGNASINATSVMGFGIRYAQDACDVTISGNAKVNATFQAIQFNTNNYVYTNSTLLVAENATITSTAGRIGGGYAIAANGKVTITGGTITGSTAGIASFQEGAIIIVDNSESGTPITINKTDIAEVVTYTVKGNPTIG